MCSCGSKLMLPCHSQIAWQDWYEFDDVQVTCVTSEQVVL